MPRLMRIGLVSCVLVVHVIALDVGDHLERQLVMIAKKNAPLAGIGYLRAFARESR